MKLQTVLPNRIALVTVVSLLAAASASLAHAAGKVTTIVAPDGGQPLSAKVDATGVVHLLMNSSDGPKYGRSTDGGNTFSNVILILDRASRIPGLEFTAWDLAVSPNGWVHVAMGTNAWKLKLPKEDWGFFYTSLEPGADSFAPVRNINRKPCEGFSLAVDDKGRVTACWLSDKLYANVSRDNGKTFAETVEIDPKINPCNCCTTSAVYGADGRLALLYREETNNDRDMHLVLWDQDSNQVSRSQVSRNLWKIDACPMTYYSVTATSEGYLAVWPTKGTIYFGRLDTAGNLRSSVEIKTAGSTGMRTGMIALSGTDGGVLIAWKKDGQLGWQKFDADGKPAGKPESMKSAGSGAAGLVSPTGDILLYR